MLINLIFFNLIDYRIFFGICMNGFEIRFFLEFLEYG